MTGFSIEGFGGIFKVEFHSLSVCVCVYLYIYIEYIYREREREWLSLHPLHQGHMVLAQALQHPVIEAPAYSITAPRTIIS